MLAGWLVRVHIPTNAKPETGKEENTRTSRNMLKYVTRPGRATNSIFLGSGGGTQTTWSHLVDSNGGVAGATRTKLSKYAIFLYKGVCDRPFLHRARWRHAIAENSSGKRPDSFRLRRLVTGISRMPEPTLVKTSERLTRRLPNAAGPTGKHIHSPHALLIGRDDTGNVGCCIPREKVLPDKAE